MALAYYLLTADLYIYLFAYIIIIFSVTALHSAVWLMNYIS